MVVEDVLIVSFNLQAGRKPSELTIACPMIPTRMALGRLGKYEETSKNAGIIVQ
jgi:hypothetical protein